MGRWLVTQNEVQFAVDDLVELKALAKKGRLAAGDMVQPPGATDWLYASEIPELKGVLPKAKDDDDDDDPPRRGAGMGAAVTGVLVVMLLGIVLLGSGAAWLFYTQLPGSNELRIGRAGLSYSEMVVTQAGAPLHAEPSASSTATTALPKDGVVALLAKRHEFYRVRTKEGAEGWVSAQHVLPLYLLGGGQVREEMDPLYNPDRYVNVKNASWLQLDQENVQKTVFNFMLENQSRYPMTDLVLIATIKDSKGNEVERVEIPVTGEIPPWEASMVGTLAPDAKDKEGRPVSMMQVSFDALAKEDPDLQLRYRDGVEVEMQTVDFTEANIDLLEIRAIPDRAVDKKDKAG